MGVRSGSGGRLLPLAGGSATVSDEVRIEELGIGTNGSFFRESSFFNGVLN